MPWGITQREIFENMLRLMRFGVHFEITLKIKWLFSYRNNYSIYSYTHICFMDLEDQMLPKKILKIWCVLVYS